MDPTPCSPTPRRHTRGRHAGWRGTPPAPPPHSQRSVEGRGAHPPWGPWGGEGGLLVERFSGLTTRISRIRERERSLLSQGSSAQALETGGAALPHRKRGSAPAVRRGPRALQTTDTPPPPPPPTRWHSQGLGIALSGGAPVDWSSGGHLGRPKETADPRGAAAPKGLAVGAAAARRPAPPRGAHAGARDTQAGPAPDRAPERRGAAPLATADAARVQARGQLARVSLLPPNPRPRPRPILAGGGPSPCRRAEWDSVRRASRVTQHGVVRADLPCAGGGEGPDQAARCGRRRACLAARWGGGEGTCRTALVHGSASEAG